MNNYFKEDPKQSQYLSDLYNPPTRINIKIMDESQEDEGTNIQGPLDTLTKRETNLTTNSQFKTPTERVKVSSKHVRSMSARMRRRAFFSLIIMTGATIFDFVVRISQHGLNLSLLTEYSELILLSVLIIFGVYSLILRFKTNLLFFIFASIAFGLLTAMMQAIIEAKNLENYYENTKRSEADPLLPELQQKYLILHSIGNICLSISCFISAVCFYFFRDALIMFDFSKNSKINNVRSPSMYGQFKLTD